MTRPSGPRDNFRCPQRILRPEVADDCGAAMFFVITAIVLLTIIWMDFSFETEINKLRAHNSQDRLQARLNAEAGLRFALLRLELYQQGRNLMEKNQKLKSNVQVQDLNGIWSIPFVYPLPMNSKTPLLVRAAIEKFMQNSLLEGELLTNVRNISQLINLNLLRLGRPKLGQPKSSVAKTSPNDLDTLLPSDLPRQPPDELNTEQVILNLEQRLTELFRQKFDRRLEEDEEFYRKYSNLEPAMLIKEIKFYVNDAQRQLEPEINEIRAQYSADDIQVKHAPMESLSELYLLRSWDDELVDMIKHDVTVHGVVAIDLNQITDQGLKLLIPEIDDQQIKDFFEYRDDPNIPHPFNHIDEFKNYITNTANILSSTEMSERIEKFIAAGIEFDVYGSLFEVVSTGRYQRSEYTIKALVEIPIKPAPWTRPTPPRPQASQDPKRDEADNPEQSTRKKPAPPTKPLPPQFLPPRVVEITIY